MRVIQLLPTLSYGDAVGNDTLAIKKLLQEMGYKTQIYAENISPRLPKGAAASVRRIPALSADDVVIYHGSVATDLNRQLLTMKGRKILIYHNVTPPHFFKEYSARHENACKKGLKEMRGLANAFDYAIAVSEFNKQDLLQMGYSCPIDVCPILIPFDDYKKPPSQKVIGQYRGDGVTNLLFVGRLAPNKRHENVIRAFYYYHKYCNPRSRLFLVGSRTVESYFQRLKDYASALGVAGQVVFTGHIPFDEILAYYHLADVFVCMSEHEGFCVPLAEAMFFHVPIVAYGCAAVPDTLDGSGILLNSADGLEAAEQIHRIVSDSTLRQQIVSGQDKRLEDFSYERVSKTISHLIQNFVNKGTE